MDKPSILLWQAVFCYSVAAMAFAGFVVLTLAMASAHPFAERPEEFFGGVTCYSIVTLPVAVFYAMAPLLPRRSWAWAANIVATVLVMPSLCLLPAALPLMLGIMKPDVKAWYGVRP